MTEKKSGDGKSGVTKAETDQTTPAGEYSSERLDALEAKLQDTKREMMNFEVRASRSSRNAGRLERMVRAVKDTGKKGR